MFANEEEENVYRGKIRRDAKEQRDVGDADV